MTISKQNTFWYLVELQVMDHVSGIQLSSSGEYLFQDTESKYFRSSVIRNRIDNYNVIISSH